MDVWRPDSRTPSRDTIITLNDYITFIIVERNMSGNYELHVFNEVGCNFELDVQCK